MSAHGPPCRCSGFYSIDGEPHPNRQCPYHQRTEEDVARQVVEEMKGTAGRSTMDTDRGGEDGSHD